MPDSDNLPPFPTRIPEKLKTIREHLGLTPDQLYINATTVASYKTLLKRIREN